MHRFRVTELGDNVFWLRGGEREHLVRVLRLAPGDKVIGFDNSGREWLAAIQRIEEKSVTCRILAEREPNVEPETQVYLVAGLAKGDKLEWVIQKGTELGMYGFVPLRAKRSVVRLEGNKAAERVERWQKIAGEAAKQSRRVREPLIREVADWQDLSLVLPPTTQWLIPYEEEKSQGLSQTLASLDRTRPIAILVGPEGGFDPSEVEFATANLKARSVSLGPRILRAETAALAALTITLAHWGDLG